MPHPYQNCVYDTPWPQEKAFAYKDRLLMLDFDSPCPSTILSNVAWYHSPENEAKSPHAHTVGEILAFIGSDPRRPAELGGQVTMWMNDEKHVLTKSFLMFIPANLPHCPYSVDRVDRPILHTSYPISREMSIRRLPGFPLREEGPLFYGENFIQTLALPAGKQALPGEVPVLYTDSSVCPGSFVCGVSWFTQAGPLSLVPSHHHEFGELLLFAGSDPANPFDLGGTVEFWLGGEPLYLTRTCYVFVPAGVEHGPLYFREVRRPIFMTGVHAAPCYCRTAALAAGEKGGLSP